MMPRRLFSSDEIGAALQRAGLWLEQTSGCHERWRRDGENGARGHTVIVPYGREVPIGTWKSILRQAGLTAEEFYELAKVKDKGRR